MSNMISYNILCYNYSFTENDIFTHKWKHKCSGGIGIFLYLNRYSKEGCVHDCVIRSLLNTSNHINSPFFRMHIPLRHPLNAEVTLIPGVYTVYAVDKGFGECVCLWTTDIGQCH